MRDPWKVLAAVLALSWVGVFVLRSVDEIAPPGSRIEIAGGAADSKEAAAAIARNDPEFVQREDASAAGADDKVSLLLRAVGLDGLPILASAYPRLANGNPVETIRAGRSEILPAMRPGLLHLRWVANGHYDRTETLQILSAPREQMHEAAMEPSAVIKVNFVTPDGERLLSALRNKEGFFDPFLGIPSLYATVDGRLPQLPLTSDDEFRSPHARWRGEGMSADLDRPDGTLSLRSRPPLLLHVLLRNRLISIQSLEQARETLEIEIDPEQIYAELSTLRVRFVDAATGAPVGKGSAFLGGRVSLGLPRLENGTFERRHIPPGVYTLEARFGSARASRPVAIPAGELVDLGEVRMSAPHPFRCRVIGEDGTPVLKAELTMRDVTHDPSLAGIGASWGVWTDESGIAEYLSLPSGEYLVSVMAPEGSGLAPAAFRLVHPGPEVAPVKLAPGREVWIAASKEDSFGHRWSLVVGGIASTQPMSCAGLPVRVTLAPGLQEWRLFDSSGAELRRGQFAVPVEEAETRVELPLP